MKARSIKYTAIALLAILTVSSCTVDEDFSDLENTLQSTQKERSVQNDSDKSYEEIIFRVATDNNARGAVDCLNNISQFKITAFEEGINYYNGRTDIVTTFDNGNSWTSDYNRFWPGNRPSNWSGLTFYAFTEGNSRNRSKSEDELSGCFDLNNSIPVIKDFYVDNDIRNQRDLMYAVAKNANKIDGEVNLNFKHALCKVNFSAANNDPKLSNIEILSIEIGGIKGEGNYQFPDLSSTNEQIINISNPDLKGRWIIPGDAEDQIYLLPDVNISLGAAGQSESTMISDDMLFIPQQVEGRRDKSSFAGSYFKITIMVTQKGKTEPNAPEVLYYPASINWKEGKCYTYDITWTSPMTIITTCESSFN